MPTRHRNPNGVSIRASVMDGADAIQVLSQSIYASRRADFGLFGLYIRL